jgi:hypothetical protein
MIFTHNLLDIFITLERDVPDEFSIPIDKSLASSRIPNLDGACDGARGTLNTPFFWFRLRSDCLFRTNFGASITINANIRDGGLLLRCHGNGPKGAYINTQATSNTSFPINNHLLTL